MFKHIVAVCMTACFLVAGGPVMAKAIKWNQLTTAEKAAYQKCRSNTCKNRVVQAAGKRLAKANAPAQQKQSRKQVAWNKLTTKQKLARCPDEACKIRVKAGQQVQVEDFAANEMNVDQGKKNACDLGHCNLNFKWAKK